jgi:acyl-CoA hydrolase
MTNENKMVIGDKVTLRVMMNYHDVHYAGDLVNGSKMLDYFGDVATELTIRLQGNEGLYRTYEHVDFLAPVHSGDVIEYVGWITRVGKTSIQFHLEAWKVIQRSIWTEPNADVSSSDVLNPPILVGMADSIGVVPKEFQRGPQDPKFKL